MTATMQNEKIVICVRDSKGRTVKPVNPFNVPEDASEAVQIAAAAVREAFQPSPVDVTVPGAEAAIAAESVAPYVPGSGKGQGRRGRPTGMKCTTETKAAMKAAKLAMWQEIKATMAERAEACEA